MLSREKNVVTEYRYYKLPLQLPILLLTGEKWCIPDVKSKRMHFHNCLEIGICHSESGQLELEDKVYDFKAGDITIIPKNISHSTFSTNGKKSLWSYIFIDTDDLFSKVTQDSQLISELALINCSGFQYIMPGSDYPKIFAIVNAVIDELKTKPPMFAHSVTSLLFSLCLEILRLQKNIQRRMENPCRQEEKESLFFTNASIKPALSYIDKNYKKPISIAELAEICNLSETHFRRSFRKIVGTPPVDYINGIRIKKSCVLLMSTEESITYISENVGFGSISSFNRCFLRVMGVAPREWRKEDMVAKGKVDRGTVVRYQGWL